MAQKSSKYEMLKEFEFDQHQENQYNDQTLPSQIMKEESRTDRTGSREAGPSKYSSGASIAAYARPQLSNRMSLLEQSLEEEVQDSYSDIDESMERYQKRKGLPVKQQQQKQEKGKSGSSGALASSSVEYHQLQTSDATSKSKMAAPNLEDKHINISQLLEKNQLKHDQLNQKNLNFGNMHIPTIPSLHTFKCEPISEEETAEPIFEQNNMTTIEKEDDGDQSTYMNQLRRQMSTNYRKGAHPDETNDHNRKSSSNFNSQRYLEEKTDFIELEKITNGKFTDRAQNQYPTARSQQKSVDISYVQSSVENTHRERREPTNGGISKYQDSSAAEEVNSQFNQKGFDMEQLSLASSDLSVPSPEQSPQKRPRAHTNMHTQKPSYQITSKQESINQSIPGHEIPSKRGSQPTFQNTSHENYSCKQDSQYFNNIMSYDQNEEVDQNAEVVKIDEAHLSRAMPMDYTEYSKSQSNTITETDRYNETDRYRPSTIQEADTCQEETAANHSSIAYNQNFTNQVYAFSVGPESKRNQSKQDMSHIISSHRILSNRDTNVHTIQEEDRTSPKYEHAADGQKLKTLQNTKKKESIGEFYQDQEESTGEVESSKDKKQSIQFSENPTVMNMNFINPTQPQSNYNTGNTVEINVDEQLHEKQQSLGYLIHGSQNNLFQRQDSADLTNSTQRGNQLKFNSQAFDSQKVPFIKSYPNQQYQQTPKLMQHKEKYHNFELPTQKLMVACIIKKEQKSFQTQRSRSRSKSNDRIRPRSSSGVPGLQRGRSVQSHYNRSQRSSRSQGSSRKQISSGLNFQRKMKNRLDTAESNLNKSFDTDYLDSLNRRKSTQTSSNEAPKFFTAQNEACEYVFKQLYDDRISKQMINTTLRRGDDCQKFISGLKKVSVDDESNMRLYKFDKCISEYQHSKSIINESNAFLRAWLNNSSSSREALNFCFLFGSSSTQKSEELNLMNRDSIIQKFLKEINEPMKFLRVSMFFQDQEFILNHRNFDSTKQSSREIGMEIREALRDKNRLVNKLTKQQPSLAIFIQKCSHFRIQINNYLFIDMADLRGLQFHDNAEIVETLTNDFGSMTNEILRQSEYYENHEFQLNAEQENSAFNTFLRKNVTQESNIMLLTYITNDQEDEISSSIALDFAHKIRSYYSGNSDECYTSTLMLSPDEIPMMQDNFSKLTLIFGKLQKMESRVMRELLKARRSSTFQAKSQALNHHRLVQLLQSLHMLVLEAIDTDLIKIFDEDHIRYIKNVINKEINSIQDKIDEVGSLMKNTTTGTNKSENKNQIINITNLNVQNRNSSREQRNQPLQTYNLGPQFSSKKLGTAISKTSQERLSTSINAITTKQSRAGSSNGNRQTIGQNSSSSRPQSGRTIQYSRPGSSLTTKSLTVNNHSKAPKAVPKAARAIIPAAKASGNITQRSGNSAIATSKKTRSRSKSTNKGRISSASRNHATTSKQKHNIKKSNEDLPITIDNVREELTNEIDQSLQSLKMKRNQINLDFDNKLVQSYDFDKIGTISTSTVKKEARPLLTEDRSDKLISLSDIDNQNAEGLRSERQKDSQNLIASIASKYDKQYQHAVEEQKPTRSLSKGAQKKNQRVNDRKRATGKKQNIIEDVLENELNIKTLYSNASLGSEKNQLAGSHQQTSEAHEKKALLNQIESLQMKLEFQKSEYETQLAMQEIELKNIHEQAQKLQVENNKLQQNMKNLHIQNLQQDQTEATDKYQNQIEQLIEDKQKAEALNSTIMKQVIIMKEAIKDSRDCELMNKELLEKNKDKNDKIVQLKNNEMMLQVQINSKDQYIEKLKERVQHLEAAGGNDAVKESPKADEYKAKYKALKVKYNELVEHSQQRKESEEQDSQMQDKIAGYEEQIEKLETEKHRFRNQTLDQKQEIRKLKQKIERLTDLAASDSQLSSSQPGGQGELLKSNRSIEDSELKSITHQIKDTVKSIKNDTQKENFSSNSTSIMKHYDSFRSKNEASGQRKKEVVADIKSLIQDYKKDKK